ncbi:uncharacterized protein E0L32_010351 [Thyridium curvatum]|uniref:Rhodopsin domain-containing protein n=1 Tax=Thyridium curvatum TaxID=1093900 RepID=A0A507AUW1_9PEZI|nr:uncharacterized protein E0L32_010351 [Thyridium curvatum]TPX08020.1 hypothetical protein E0L32_010351 [Thyridium curvatum]
MAEGLHCYFKSFSGFRTADRQQYAYVSDFFYIITMCVTKCAGACLFLRLSPDRTHVRSSQAVLITSSLFAITSIFMLALRCNMQHPWLYAGERCEGLYTRWQAITAFDVLTELGLFAIALHMAHGLFVSPGKKAVVLLAFALRLGVVAPSIMRLNYLSSALASPDPSLDGVLAVVCTQIEICYAIIATTTPCLRPFMSALNTGYGGPGPIPTPKGSRASSSGHDRSFTARSGQSAKQKKQQRFSGLGTFELEEKAQRPLPELRWDKTQYNVAIETGERPRTGQEIEPMPDRDQNSLQSQDNYEDQFRQS